MKKLLSTIIILTGSLAAQAYDYPYLTVQKTDGAAVSMAVESLVITFSDGQLVATNAEGTLSLTLSELSTMIFESSPTSIDSPFEATDTADTQVEVYGTNGMFMGRFNSAEQATQQLRAGIYVMKQNGITKKVAVK